MSEPTAPREPSVTASDGLTEAGVRRVIRAVMREIRWQGWPLDAEKMLLAGVLADLRGQVPALASSPGPTPQDLEDLAWLRARGEPHQERGEPFERFWRIAARLASLLGLETPNR